MNNHAKTGTPNQELNQAYTKSTKKTFVDSVNIRNKHDSKIGSYQVQVVEKEPELLLWPKICFAFAGMPYQIYFTAISVFLNVFLLEKAGLPPGKAALILFISRMVDAVTDPIYGFIVNKSPLTRYGRMKPWIMVSLPFASLAYIMVWYIPEGFSQNQMFAWFLLWNSVLFTLLTGIRIPHTSMTMYLTTSQTQRQSATVFRMGFEMIGVLFVLGIQGPFVATSGCINPNSTDNSRNVTRAVEAVQTPTFFEVQTYVIFACIMSGLFIVGNGLLIFFVKEIDVKQIVDKTAKKINLLKECKQIFTFKPYLILLSAFVTNQIAIQSIQANIQLYFEYGFFKAKDFFTPVMLTLLGLAIFYVPIWQFLMVKIGKIKSMFLGNLLVMPLLIGCIFFRENTSFQIGMLFTLVAIGANGLSSTFLVPWSILPVTLDAYFLKYSTRPDALFYTFFLLGTKILISFYLGIFQLVLGLIGYENEWCAEFQAPIVSETIIYMFAPIPIALLCISCLIITFFPIDEKLALENSERIQQLKKLNEAKVNGYPMVSPITVEEKRGKEPVVISEETEDSNLDYFEYLHEVRF